MRQPLATMMRMPNALIQCVMRTISGWILTHCSCAASIGVSSSTSPLWSEGIGYTLQRTSPVAFAEAEQGLRKASPESDHLEELPHFRRAHQAVRLVGEGKELRAVLRRRARHDLGNAAIDEELRLAGVAGDFQPALARGPGNGAEIDVAGDVLQAREEKGIGVRVVAVMAHERPILALRMVVLLLRKAVVDEKRHAFLEHLRERAHKALRGLLDLGAKALGQFQRARGSERPPGSEPPGPAETIVSHADAAFLQLSALNAHHVGRHRVEHFIAEHDAGKHGRQAIEPGHALEQVRHSRRERVPASLAKIGRELEDEIVARDFPRALELLEQRRSERRAPGAY